MIRILKTDIIPGMLVLMWSYAAASKLLDYETSRSQMLNQVFSHRIANTLVWAVPATELILAGCLFLWQRLALYASFILLSLFTLYIGVVMTGIFGRIPCSCGGILEQMSWGQHLVFNLFFIAITILGLNLNDRDKGSQEGVLIKPPAVRRV